MRRVWAAACVLGLVGCGGASGSKVRQLGGILTVTPANLDFGDVALGKEATHPVTLHNDGIVPMTVEANTVFPDATFEVAGLPVTLGVGETAALRVRYQPVALGSHEQKLELVTDAPSDMPVDLRGHAVRGLAQLSGDSFDFGDVVVNETATQDLQLVNNDGHAETSVVIDPPASPSAFAVKPPGEQALSAEQSMVVTLQFRPDRLGDFASAVMVTPCPTCSPRPIQLTGRGVDRLLLVRPESIDFGNLKLGAGASQPFTVTNLSKSPVAIESLSPSGSPELTAALDSATAFPLTLQPGQTVAGTARFRPRTLGAQSTQVTLAASDGGPGLLALAGLGMGPVLLPTPKALFVGPAALGTTRNSGITITNVGLDPKNDSPLVLSDVRIDGNDGSWAVRVDSMNVGEPGSSTQAHIAFTPQATGLSRATLVLESNDGLHPHVEVPLAATGRDLLPCTLQVQPGDPVDFGLQKLFAPAVQGFELVNTTADDCIVGEPAIVSGGPQFRWPGGIVPAGRTLPPGHRMSVRVAFVADQARTYSGAVQFYVSNKAAPAMTVNLVGAGDSSCFFVTPPTVDFGATTQGCGVPDQFAFAVNHCGFPVTVTALQTSGPPFSAAAPLPLRIAPQTSANLSIGYAPPSPGDDVGAVRVFTDMRAEPFQSGITGGSRDSGTVLDQWDQSTPKVDMLIVIDNSGSMQEEQQALAANLDHLWNRIALANADFHIAVTTTGMSPYTFKQCPGGADGGEAGRFFPVDDSRPRLLTPQTPDVRSVLFANTNVGTC
ncbi:MAG TPA: choice-of-anchor D domain-containing protein, partial [Myxococcales bacterium]|nr:choice-of-anchor D domain-containing protein [Myxococcales bacterium]